MPFEISLQKGNPLQTYVRYRTILRNWTFCNGFWRSALVAGANTFNAIFETNVSVQFFLTIKHTNPASSRLLDSVILWTMFCLWYLVLCSLGRVLVLAQHGYLAWINVGDLKLMKSTPCSMMLCLLHQLLCMSSSTTLSTALLFFSYLMD